MFTIYAKKNRLRVEEEEPLTSGSVNVYTVRFGFSGEWEGLTRTAVFKAAGDPVAVLLDDAGECVIPWEALAKPLVHLYAGVYGTKDGSVVLPTVWADLGTILPGAACGPNAHAPTPELWEQQLAAKGDKLGYTGDGELGLYAGDRLLSCVPVQGGGEGGTADHRALSHRDAEGQHPIEAITNLGRELSRRISSDDALSIVDIIKIMEG